jgi:hypothetical protein
MKWPADKIVRWEYFSYEARGIFFGNIFLWPFSCAEIVQGNDVARFKRGNENLLAQVLKLSPSIGPSRSHGASTRS